MSRRHDADAARGLGVISSVHGRDSGKGFIFATMPNNSEVFLHRSVFRPAALYDEVMPGDKVSFAVADAPKGLRGHDCRRMSESELDRHTQEMREHHAAIQERRGNTAQHGERQSFVEERRVYDGMETPRRRDQPRHSRRRQ